MSGFNLYMKTNIYLFDNMSQLIDHENLKFAAISNGVTVVMKGLAFTRSEGLASVQLPFGAGATVHVYVFFQNDGNTKYSKDFYAQVNIPGALIP
jgi:hypothetical protein